MTMSPLPSACRVPMESWVVRRHIHSISRGLECACQPSWCRPTLQLALVSYQPQFLNHLLCLLISRACFCCTIILCKLITMMTFLQFQLTVYDFYIAVVHKPNEPTPTSEFEHSSICATAKKLFNLPGGFLTKRDAWAGTFDVALTRKTPRTDCPGLSSFSPYQL